jgi:hypothetical protein
MNRDNLVTREVPNVHVRPMCRLAEPASPLRTILFPVSLHPQKNLEQGIPVPGQLTPKKARHTWQFHNMTSQHFPYSNHHQHSSFLFPILHACEIGTCIV